jgi:hypothetical protein
MTDRKPPPAAARAERLAEALRANLRRRKAAAGAAATPAQHAEGQGTAGNPRPEAPDSGRPRS